MTIDDIISCVNVVAYYNPSMRSLHDSLVYEKPNMAASEPAVKVAFEEGVPAYDTLTRVQVNLADAVHDYVYSIVHPLDSVQTKNTVREQICRELFGISANF